LSCSTCRWAKTIPKTESPDDQTWVRCAKGRWQSGTASDETFEVYNKPQELIFVLEDVVKGGRPLKRFFLTCSYFESMDDGDQ